MIVMLVGQWEGRFFPTDNCSRCGFDKFVFQLPGLPGVPQHVVRDFETCEASLQSSIFL